MTALKKTTTLLILLILPNFFIHSQSISKTNKQFSKEDLESDFNVFRKKYETTLANLYLYVGKQHLNKIFDSLYSNITPMTGQEFYRYITPLSSIIKDGHSNIFPAEHETDFHNLNSKFFPFNIFWTGNKMFITLNLSNDSTILTGTEIVSINGINAAEIMSKLISRQVRDGENESYALWILNNYFREYYSYHFGHPDIFTLLVNENDNKTRTINLRGESKEMINIYRSQRTPINTIYKISKNNSLYIIDKQNDRALFIVKSWDNKKLKKEIDILFSKLQSENIGNLILDLRDNQGGDFYPAIHLLSYLLNEPFQYFTELKSVSGSNDSAQILKNENGRMLGIHKIQPNVYQGKLVVLINGGCFSNTACFCSRLEFYNRAIFVGTETGGNKIVFSGEFGLKSKTILPNTKIQCENANYQMVVTDIKLNNGHGVLPTYYIYTDIRDEIVANDAILEKAFNLIK